MNGHLKQRLKHTLKNIAVDAASVLIFLSITYVAAQGFMTLYTSYYNTMKLPPEVVSAASTQFTAAISLVYLLLQTRKHYSKLPDEQPSKETEDKPRPT